METKLHVFLTSGLDGWEMSDSPYSRFIPIRKRDRPDRHGDEEENSALCTKQTPANQYILTGLYLKHSDSLKYLDIDWKIILKSTDLKTRHKN
jgi:hypothetical protein